MHVQYRWESFPVSCIICCLLSRFKPEVITACLINWGQSFQANRPQKERKSTLTESRLLQLKKVNTLFVSCLLFVVRRSASFSKWHVVTTTIFECQGITCFKN